MAKPNWLEELAENWFRMRGYITQLHVRIPEFGRLELDLLAFNDEEFAIIDLQTYVGEKGSVKVEATNLIKRFKTYDELLKISPYKDVSKNKKLKRLFIAEAPARRALALEFKNLIEKSGIEFMPMEEFLPKVLHEVDKYSHKKRWPLSHYDISRLLYELAQYELIK